jgi:hypothetical protein
MAKVGTDNKVNPNPPELTVWGTGEKVTEPRTYIDASAYVYICPMCGWSGTSQTKLEAHKISCQIAHNEWLEKENQKLTEESKKTEEIEAQVSKQAEEIKELKSMLEQMMTLLKEKK